MAEFVRVPIDDEDEVGSAIVLFETAESSLVSLHSGRPDVTDLAEQAAGRLTSIADMAEQVLRAVGERLRPDAVELEVAVGLSGEVGWFVAKSSTTGSLKLKLSWKGRSPADQAQAAAAVDGSSPGQAG